MCIVRFGDHLLGPADDGHDGVVTVDEKNSFGQGKTLNET